MQSDDRSAQELLIDCLRTSMACEVSKQRVRDVLGEPVNWSKFFTLTRAHAVEPLIAATLARHFSKVCPKEVLEYSVAVLRSTAADNLRKVNELMEIVDLLRSHAVPAIFFKGPVLSAQLYENIGLRHYGDLDILVETSDYYIQLPPILEANGWTTAVDYGFECHFQSERHVAQLDVHRTLSPQLSVPFRLTFHRAWRNREYALVCGRRVDTLSRCDLVLYLCVQLAQDAGWSEHPLKLIKVCDIAQAIRRLDPFDWTVVVDRARELGVLRILCVSMQVTARMLGVEVPRPIQVASESPARLDTLVRHIEERLFNAPGQKCSHPEFLDEANWHRALRERARDRIRAHRHFLITYVAPNRSDFTFVRLPRRLSLLYFLVRPIHVAHKHLVKAVGGVLR